LSFHLIPQTSLLLTFPILGLQLPNSKTKGEKFENYSPSCSRRRDRDRDIFRCLGNRDEKDGESHFSGKSEKQRKTTGKSWCLVCVCDCSDR
jgi:hypothetical protein